MPTFITKPLVVSKDLIQKAKTLFASAVMIGIACLALMSFAQADLVNSSLANGTGTDPMPVPPTVTLALAETNSAVAADSAELLHFTAQGNLLGFNASKLKDR